MVYRTSVQTPQQVQALRPKLDQLAGAGNWNFALDDADRILRIANQVVDPLQPIRLLHQRGFFCSELED